MLNKSSKIGRLYWLPKGVKPARNSDIQCLQSGFEKDLMEKPSVYIFFLLWTKQIHKLALEEPEQVCKANKAMLEAVTS